MKEIHCRYCNKNMEMEMILLLTNLILERPMSHFHKFEAMIVFDRFVFGWLVL